MNNEAIDPTKQALSYSISALGALGGALQNYIAVDIFLRGLLSGAAPLSQLLSGFIQSVAVGAGGVCSGMVNFYINVGLLDKFIDRMTHDSACGELDGWNEFMYYAGIFVFAVTGVLFGATAFTFGITSPLSALAVASGVFVAIIMTIQEVETWLQSFDHTSSNKSVYELFTNWMETLTFGKACGHIIAAGNVIALSVLFTLGLAEVLITLQVAAFTAFVIGLTTAFTFGAFTEFYFYNFFLADFCADFSENWELMKETPNAALGFVCVSINAFVNAALTYSGVGLMTGLLTLAGVALPPVAVIVALSAISAFFAGSASFILGLDFWIGERPKATELEMDALPIAEGSQTIAANDETPRAAHGLFSKSAAVVECATCVQGIEQQAFVA